MRQPAAQVADHGLAEFNQPQGDVRAVHHLARQHKEGDRHQRKAVHAVVDIAIKQHEVAGLPVHPQQNRRSYDKTKEHRKTQQQPHQEQRQEK